MAYDSGSVNYGNGLPLAGDIKTLTVTAAADTYYVGMPVTYDSVTNDNWEYSATAIQGICVEDKVLAAEGSLLIAVTGTEWLESGLVDDSNAALTITDDARAAALLNGIILR